MTSYIVKFGYTQVVEDGKEKRITEEWIFEAETYTQAEAYATKEISTLHADMTIKAIKPARYADILTDEEGDFFFSTRTNLITLNEVSGKEEKVAVNVLIQACEISDAIAMLEKYWGEGVSDYEITQVAKTNIVEFIKLEKED